MVLTKDVATKACNLLREKSLKTKLLGGIGMNSLDLVGFKYFSVGGKVDFRVVPIQ